jgi:hypothetical protein
VKLVLQSVGGKTTARLGTTIPNGIPQQAPDAPERVAPVDDTAVDVPTSGPTRWDLQALTCGSSRP